MEEGNGEGEVPGVDTKPQTQRSTAQDSFVVNAGGLVPPPGSAESPSAQEEQPGAGPVVGGPGPSLEQHLDLSDMMHLSLDSLLLMPGSQVREVMRRLGASAEECSRLTAALSCLKSATESGTGPSHPRHP
jgi:hypothetical protein